MDQSQEPLVAHHPCLVAWLWRDRFPGVRAVAFAPPPTACARLSRLVAERGIATALVLGDDIVARLSVGSVVDTARAAHALSVAPGAAARVIDHALGGGGGARAETLA